MPRNSLSTACYHRCRTAVLPRSEIYRSRRAPFFLIFSLLCLVISPRAFPAESNSLDDAVRQLADRIGGIPNLHGPLRLEFHVDANFAADSTWQDTLRQELEKRRFPVTDEPSAPLLRIGFAETPTQVVLTAITRNGDRDDVCIVTLNRAALSVPALAIAPVRIARQLIYESSDRILDASAFGNAAEGGLNVLLDRNAQLFALRLDSSGAVKQTISLAAANLRATRDPRGELMDKGLTAVVQLPGKICEFAWAGGEEPKCRAKKVEARSATVLTSPCDTSNWKLEAKGEDWSAPDLLQIAPDSTARAGSAALFNEFPGPILSINGELDPGSALIVAHNLRTGNYEVYKITLLCGN